MHEFHQNIKFKKHERIASSFLILFILGLYLFEYFYSPPIKALQANLKLEDLISEKTNMPVTESEIIVEELDKKKQLPTKEKDEKKFVPSRRPTGPFNPNQIDSTTFLSYGLNKWAVSNIMKYRRKGGHFKSCDDLQKIYGINQDTYEKLIPLCNIPTLVKEKREPHKSTKKQFKKPKPIRIEINTATAEELRSIKGIGPVLSERIIKYRDMLGGFCNLDQLKEVYGLESEIIDENASLFHFNDTTQKVSLNSDYKTLIRHPYLEKHHVKAILAYRHQHGAFKEKEDIKKILAVPPDLAERMLPYLEP